MIVRINFDMYKKNKERGGCPCKIGQPCPCPDMFEEIEEKGMCHCGMVRKIDVPIQYTTKLNLGG